MQVISIQVLIKLGEFFLAFISEPPPLLYKNRGKIYKTIILCVVLYGCEPWSQP
jgi:hypothetical protein